MPRTLARMSRKLSLTLLKLTLLLEPLLICIVTRYMNEAGGCAGELNVFQRVDVDVTTKPVCIRLLSMRQLYHRSKSRTVRLEHAKTVGATDVIDGESLLTLRIHR